ncbi:unnamed protein product, partial [Rotaria magnacalcarata]
MLIVLKVSLETFIQTDDIDYNLDDLFDEKKEKDTPPHHDSETMIPELEALLKENDESGTNDKCHPALLLLWKPDLLIQYEISYRTSFTAKSASISDYKNFNGDISKPFRQMVSNIFVNLK